MTIPYDDAVSQMFKLFNVAWQANSAAIVGYVPEIRWQDKENADPPPKIKFWCRVSQVVIKQGQATLSDFVAEPFKKRYGTIGILTVQLFAPKSVKDSGVLLRKLAEVAQKAYRGKTTQDGILFNNVTIRPVPMEESFFKSNVTAEFEFSEIG